MGQGVNDNTVIGATGSDGKAMGWSGTSVAFSESNALRPEHMISTLCSYLGYSDIAQEFSDAPVSNLLSYILLLHFGFKSYAQVSQHEVQQFPFFFPI